MTGVKPLEVRVQHRRWTYTVLWPDGSARVCWTRAGVLRAVRAADRERAARSGDPQGVVSLVNWYQMPRGT